MKAKEGVLLFYENASELNSTHSETIAGKPMNISTPAILWSFDTISKSPFAELL